MGDGSETGMRLAFRVAENLELKKTVLAPEFQAQDTIENRPASVTTEVFRRSRRSRTRQR